MPGAAVGARSRPRIGCGRWRTAGTCPGSFERFLIARGERVVRVPTRLMANSRRSSRERGKSDRIDALAVARAALGRGHRDAADRRAGRAGARHPAAGRPSRAAGPAARRAQQHAAVAPARSLARAASCRAARCSTASGVRGSRGAWRAPSRRCASGSPATSCAGYASSPRRSTRSRPRSPSSSARSRRSCSTEPGFGPLTAAKLVGEIAGAARFASDAKLARAAGLAPIPVSSGRTDRHRLDRGGNRQINAAIHRVAVTRARCHPETIEFIARKKTEGKTHREAIRCLKRHLARRIWQLLRAPHPVSETAPHPSIS